MISWDLNREKIKKLETLKKARKIKLFQVSPKNIEIISTHLLTVLTTGAILQLEQRKRVFKIIFVPKPNTPDKFSGSASYL